MWVAKSILCRETELSRRPCHTCEDCRRVDTVTHPDSHVLFPIRKSSAEEDIETFLAAKRADPFAVVHFANRANLAIDRIRGLISELSKTSVEGGAKVAIIIGADQMDKDSQTGLLKSIEEPPPGGHFVLTAADSGRIYPTIRSRCQMIRFTPVSSERISSRLRSEMKLDQSQADLIAGLCGGGWGNALRLASEEAQAWRQFAVTFWQKAFQIQTSTLLDEIGKAFQKRSLDQVLEAFDVWAFCLRGDCARAADDSAGPATLREGAPIRDLETGWACWRILGNGRSVLRVNVLPKSAVAGTFLALRGRLRRRQEPLTELNTTTRCVNHAPCVMRRDGTPK
jgi:DNA polymerase III delta prime subunit